MYIHVRVINGKAITINNHEEDIKKHQKKAIELRTNAPTNQQRLTIQGKQLDGVGTMKNCNIAKAAIVELTLNLQEWTKKRAMYTYENYGRATSRKKSIRTLQRHQ